MPTTILIVIILKIYSKRERKRFLRCENGHFNIGIWVLGYGDDRDAEEFGDEVFLEIDWG